MIRTVLQASSTASLIALATVKLRLGITDSTQDALLADLITEASSAITDYIDRDLARQRYEERSFGNGRCSRILSRYPVDPDSLAVTVDGVAVTDFELEPESATLYRQIGWTFGDGEDRNVVDTYRAGFVLPDQIVTWAAGITPALGSWLRPTNPSKSSFLMEVTTSGLTSGAEPTWPVVAGDTVASGAATVTARVARELPPALAGCAFEVVKGLYTSRMRNADVAQITADGFSQSFFSRSQEVSDGVLPSRVLKILDRWRASR